MGPVGVRPGVSEVKDPPVPAAVIPVAAEGGKRNCSLPQVTASRVLTGQLQIQARIAGWLVLLEGRLLDVLGQEGVGCIAFSPLAQGVLTGKYLGGVPTGSRATVAGGSLSSDQISEQNLAHVRA